MRKLSFYSSKPRKFTSILLESARLCGGGVVVDGISGFRRMIAELRANGGRLVLGPMK